MGGRRPAGGGWRALSPSPLCPPLLPPGGKGPAMRWMVLLPVLEVRRGMPALEAAPLSPRSHHGLFPVSRASQNWLKGLVQEAESRKSVVQPRPPHLAPPSTQLRKAGSTNAETFRMLAYCFGVNAGVSEPTRCCPAWRPRDEGDACAHSPRDRLCTGRPDDQGPLGPWNSATHAHPMQIGC